uniref:Uncharacterized protein n=1 Tax=Glossina austeni TaxID=7395 RepID=A0A1A9UQX1_GLOAU
MATFSEFYLLIKRPFAGGSRVDGVEGGAGGGAVATFKGMLAELVIIPPTIPILPFGPGAVLTFGMSVNDLGLLTTPIEGIGVGPPVGVVGSEPVAALVPVTECNEGSCVFPVAFIAPSLAEIGMMTSLLEKSLALADGVQNCCTSLAILKAFSSDRNMSSTIIFETAEGFVWPPVLPPLFELFTGVNGPFIWGECVTTKWELCELAVWVSSKI